MRAHGGLFTVLAMGAGCCLYACGGDDSTPEASASPPGRDAGSESDQRSANIDANGPDTTPADATDGSLSFDGPSSTDVTSDVVRPTDDASESGVFPSSDAASEADVSQRTSEGGTDGGGEGGVSAGATFTVLRIGGLDGTLVRNYEAQAFLDEYDIDGRFRRTIAVPTIASGEQHGLIMQSFQVTPYSESMGGAEGRPADGILTRSGDGRYLVLAGYVPGSPADAGALDSSAEGFYGSIPPGLAYSAAERARVIARVDSAGAVDTSTLVRAFGSGSIAGAATQDGTAFWSAGVVASSPAASVMYNRLGDDGNGAALGNGTALDVSASMNAIGISDGALYVSSGSPLGYLGIRKVGQGLPTTAAQPLTAVINLPEGAPYGFQFLDMDSKAGADTLYMADGSKGVRKFRLDSSTGAWVSSATFASRLPHGAFGVAAIQQGASVIVFATSIEGDAIVKFVDDGLSADPLATPIASVRKDPSVLDKGYVYRGVAVSASR